MKEVKIIDGGYFYTTYTEWAAKHNLKNFNHSKVPHLNKIYEVIVEGIHGYHLSYLYGIRDKITGEEYIIGKRGVKVLFDDKQYSLF